MNHLLPYWSFDISSAILFLTFIAFVVATKSFDNKKILAITSLLLIICLFSPLHLLASQYLFSAHMTVHVLLLLCAGPLLIMNLSQQKEQFKPIFLFLKKHPAFGWLTGVGIMWFWHIPLVFNSAMSSMHQDGFNVISIVEALSLILAGMLFSAPVIHPNKKFRIDALSGVVYLFTACIGCSLLGLLITFAPTGTYHHFLSMHDAFRLNKTIVQGWGITQSIDQQAAGLIMWVACCLIYVTGAMYLLVHWFKQKEETITYPKQI
jgi:cytochrome c oxidase assembly factor CtaG